MSIDQLKYHFFSIAHTSKPVEQWCRQWLEATRTKIQIVGVILETMIVGFSVVCLFHDECASTWSQVGYTISVSDI